MDCLGSRCSRRRDNDVRTLELYLMDGVRRVRETIIPGCQEIFKLQVWGCTSAQGTSFRQKPVNSSALVGYQYELDEPFIRASLVGDSSGGPWTSSKLLPCCMSSLRLHPRCRKMSSLFNPGKTGGGALPPCPAHHSRSLGILPGLLRQSRLLD